MKSSRALTGAFIVGAVAVASMFAAAPASAATLPDGQQITVIDIDGQFSSVNPATAGLTAVGTPTGLEGDEPTGVDVDDDGQGYAITTYYDYFDPNPEDEIFGFEVADGAYLYAADAKTGTLTYLDDIRFFFQDFTIRMDECTGIDYSGGEIYLACTVFADEEGERDIAYIGVWDFDLGAAVPLVTLNGDVNIDYDAEDAPNEPAPGFDFIHISAMAINPVSGLIYIFGEQCPEGCFDGIWTLSEDDGATDVSGLEGAVYGADFDRGGQLWATTDVDDAPPLRVIGPGESGLVTVDLTTGAFVSNTAWTPQPQETIQPITVWGKPALANTGATISPIAPIAASGILLLGAILAAGTMVLRRRNADA